MFLVLRKRDSKFSFLKKIFEERLRVSYVVEEYDYIFILIFSLCNLIYDFIDS